MTTVTFQAGAWLAGCSMAWSRGCTRLLRSRHGHVTVGPPSLACEAGDEDVGLGGLGGSEEGNPALANAGRGRPPRPLSLCSPPLVACSSSPVYTRTGPSYPHALPVSLSSFILGFSWLLCVLVMSFSPCSPEGSTGRNTTGFRKPPPSTSLSAVLTILVVALRWTRGLPLVFRKADSFHQTRWHSRS